MRGRWLQQGFLLFLLSCLNLAILEGVVRWGWPQTKTTEFLAGGSLGQDDPLLGHRLRPLVHTRTRAPEFTVEYQTNSEGWRDAEVHAQQKAPGTQRILLLGDSFTFGEGVTYDAIWPVLLEAALNASGKPRVEVIKAGVPGYDTRQEVLLLTQTFARYQPDHVFITLVPNDLFTNARLPADVAAGLPAESQVITRGEEKKLQPKLHVVSLLRRLLLTHDGFYVRLYTATERGRLFAAFPDPVIVEKLAITAELLAHAATFCQSHGAQFGVISLPQQFQVLARDLLPPAVDIHQIDRELGAIAAKAGYTWIPLLPPLAARAVSTELYFRADGHLNPAGHRAVSEILVPLLHAQPLIDPLE